ncbi:MAG: carbohydrate kinase family protein [Anaerolineae bacterium]|nr:carbohydrate kinase family protein [Anaerolineae bacterium]
MNAQDSVLIIGGVSWNAMVYVNAFPTPQPQTVFSRGFHETVGSTGSGKALSLHRLGMPVTLHALIGDDAPGQATRDYFNREGVRFIYDIDPAGTQRHINLMDKEEGRISIFVVYGTFEPAFDMKRLETLIGEHDHIVLNISNYCRYLIPLIKQAGKAIWCDLHDYDGKNPFYDDFIKAADYLFMSSDAHGIKSYRAFMETQIAAGKRLVVSTHGKNGSTALTADGRWIETPAISEYSVKDTNGAGDGFVAGVLYGYANNYPIEQCLQFGSIVGGLAVTSLELAAPELNPTLLATEYERLFNRKGI